MRDSLRDLRILGSTLTLLVALAACGGGGGGDSRPEPADRGGGSGGEAPPTEPAENRPPSARFTISEPSGPAPLTASFDAGPSSDPDGRITAYRWDFGDGGSATGPIVTHTFTGVGTFDVTLEISDDGGLTDTMTERVDVSGATVSGTIRLSAGTSVDSDVNDRLTTPVSNNSFGDAQLVTNPLRLGGFVNRPGTGSPDGNFRSTGDPEDFFAVELRGAEHIVLAIGDRQADLDLELYNDASPPELIDASISQNPGQDPSEDLAAPPTAGRYFVRVVAVSGASNYVLSISEEIAPPAPRRAKRLTDPFVPGEVLVVRHNQAMPERLGIRPAHAGAGQRLEPLDRAGAPAPAMRLAEARLAEGAVTSPALQARYDTLHAARRLGAGGTMAVAELNTLRRPQRFPNDPFYHRQWHLRAIGLERAWDITTGSVSGRRPIVVAVVDTGVLVDHPDLRDQLLRDADGQIIGYDFVQDVASANDGDGLDPDPSDPGDDELGDGQGSFHGTHVAGLIAARSHNGIGVAGVSWHARIMPVRALGIGGGSTFDVIQAVRFAAQLDNVSNTVPPVRADIINMSLGSDFHSEAEQQALNQVRARGIFLVASAGNDSSRIPSYPAAYHGVIGVSAVDQRGHFAFYSNFGPHIDIAAPGGDLTADRDDNGRSDGVASTIGFGGGDDIELTYGMMDGTSMAAPHVSGVIALMKSVHPELTPGEFDTMLRSGRLTREAGPPGRDDRFGWGIIDAERAVLAVQDQVAGGLGAQISVSTDRLDFQLFIRELHVSVSNTGDRPTTVTLQADAPWVTVEPVSGSDDGFGKYQVSVDRSGLDPGTYQAAIDVEPHHREMVEPASVRVIMRVEHPDADADAGQHYVMLVDSADEPVAAQTVTAGNGEYRFDLEHVPPGEYRLFAGTDLDDDDIICEGGEACGAFPNLAGPAIITVNPRQQPEMTDMSFSSEFRTTATRGGTDRPDAASRARRIDKPESQ